MELLSAGYNIFTGLSITAQSLLLTNLYVYIATGRLHIINELYVLSVQLEVLR
jgi:hypothetical protein